MNITNICFKNLKEYISEMQRLLQLMFLISFHHVKVLKNKYQFQTGLIIENNWKRRVKRHNLLELKHLIV
jgi:hypothetical protein